MGRNRTLNLGDTKHDAFLENLKQYYQDNAQEKREKRMTHYNTHKAEISLRRKELYLISTEDKRAKRELTRLNTPQKIKYFLATTQTKWLNNWSYIIK